MKQLQTWSAALLPGALLSGALLSEVLSSSALLSMAFLFHATSAEAAPATRVDVFCPQLHTEDQASVESRLMGRMFSSGRAGTLTLKCTEERLIGSFKAPADDEARELSTEVDEMEAEQLVERLFFMADELLEIPAKEKPLAISESVSASDDAEDPTPSNRAEFELLGPEREEPSSDSEKESEPLVDAPPTSPPAERSREVLWSADLGARFTSWDFNMIGVVGPSASVEGVWPSDFGGRIEASGMWTLRTTEELRGFQGQVQGSVSWRASEFFSLGAGPGVAVIQVLRPAELSAATGELSLSPLVALWGRAETGPVRFASMPTRGFLEVGLQNTFQSRVVSLNGEQAFVVPEWQGFVKLGVRLGRHK